MVRGPAGLADRLVLSSSPPSATRTAIAIATAITAAPAPIRIRLRRWALSRRAWVRGTSDMDDQGYETHLYPGRHGAGGSGMTLKKLVERLTRPVEEIDRERLGAFCD